MSNPTGDALAAYNAETMVERVARAMAKLVTEPGRHPDSEIVHCTFLARAAIEAMREPTQAMSLSGVHGTDDESQTWRQMIDAALSEPNPRKS